MGGRGAHTIREFSIMSTRLDFAPSGLSQVTHALKTLSAQEVDHSKSRTASNEGYSHFISLHGRLSVIPVTAGDPT